MSIIESKEFDIHCVNGQIASSTKCRTLGGSPEAPWGEERGGEGRAGEGGRGGKGRGGRGAKVLSYPRALITPEPPLTR